MLIISCASNQEHTSNLDIAQIRTELGLEYLKINELEKAKQNFDKALEHVYNYGLALLGLAGYYHKEKDLINAEKYYLLAIKDESIQSYAINNYSIFLCQQQQNQKGNKQFSASFNSIDKILQQKIYNNIINSCSKQMK